MIYLSYVAILGLGVVRYFEGFEADGLGRPEGAWLGGVWMAVLLLCFVLEDLRLTRGHPLHVDIAVALVVSRVDSECQRIFLGGIYSRQRHLQAWKHAPSPEIGE